jgi:hypothetical protein
MLQVFGVISAYFKRFDSVSLREAEIVSAESIVHTSENEGARKRKNSLSKCEFAFFGMSPKF